MTPVQVQPQIEEAIRARKFVSVRDALADWDPADVADLIEQLESEDRAVMFRLIPRDLASDTFEYLSPEYQEEILKALGREQVASILNDMSPDDRTALLEELPSSAMRKLVNLLSFEERQVARTLLGYPEDSIGRLMTPDYVAVRPERTVAQALDHIRRYGDDKETLNVIYVVNKETGELLDDLRIRQVLLASPDQKISELCDGHVVALRARDDQETAVAQFKQYDRVALPVTDSAGVLLGIVTVDDVMDVAEEEATEDMQKVGGMEALDEPYLRVGFVKMIRKRVGWLIVLFLGQMLTVSAMEAYHSKLAGAVFLVVFLPLIASSGGNSGSQAATMIVRAIALGEVTLRHWWAVMRREILSGLALGLCLGTLGFARIALGAMFTEAYGESWILTGITISITLVGVTLWGTLLGSMLPFVLKGLGADPAASSTPVVTTIVDVTGLLFYFTVATIVLAGTL